MREVSKRSHTEYLTISISSQPLYIYSFIHLKKLEKRKELRNIIKREKPTFPSSSKGCTTFIDDLLKKISPIRHVLDWLYLNSNPSGKRPHGQLTILHDRFMRYHIPSQWFPWLQTHYTFLCGINVKIISKAMSHNQIPSSLTFFIIPHSIVLVLYTVFFKFLILGSPMEQVSTKEPPSWASSRLPISMDWRFLVLLILSFF